MSKKALLTVDSVHRKVKKGFITEDAVHRKILKAYMTVGGVYRPCWSEGMGVAYYGQITPMSVVRSDFGTASNGTHALFAVGASSDGRYENTVEAYDDLLGRKSVSYGERVKYPQGGRIGNTAIFQGGQTYDYEFECDTTTSYAASFDASLTSISNRTGECRFEHKAARAGNCLVFHGGRCYDAAEYAGWMLDHCDAYTESLTRTSNYFSSEGEMRLHAGASVGNYALFGGGWNGDDFETTTIAAVNSSLQFSYRSMSVARYDVTATNVGNYALFIGGFSNDLFGTCATVDAFDTSLTRTTATPISTASEGKVSTTIVVDGVEYAVIAGGVTDVDVVNDVDVYDASLTRTTYPNVFNRDNRPHGGDGRSNALTPVGNYILYAKNGTQYNGRVDALLVG